MRVLELEKELETERYKLGQVRKRHYQLAGENEGWEIEVKSKYCLNFYYPLTQLVVKGI